MGYKIDHTGVQNVSSFGGDIFISHSTWDTGSDALQRGDVTHDYDYVTSFLNNNQDSFDTFASTKTNDIGANASYSWDLFNWTSNATEQSNSSLGGDSLASMITKGILLSALVTMTIVGNVLVLLAVFVNAHLRSTTHYFIANLAVADLLLGSAVLPFSASLEVVDRWAFGQLFCNIWAAVDVLCCTASIMSLCVISIDRYIGVTRPLQHSSIMTEKRAYLIIVMVWVLSTTISVAPLFGWKEPPHDDPNVCEVTKQLGYVLFSVSGSFYIPLAIILVVYFRVYREALKQSRFLKTGVKTSKGDESRQEITLRIHTGRPSQVNINPKNPAGGNVYQSSSSSEHSEESGRKPITKMTLAGKIAKFKREKKAAKTLGIVVGVFILCWFPFFFVLPLEALCHSCSIPGWLFKIFFWLGYFNSMMNPIIYACSSREFKRAFIRILKCQWRRRPRSFLHDLGQSHVTESPTRRFCLCGLGKRFRNLSRKRRRKHLLERAGKRGTMRMDMSAMLYTSSYGGRTRRFDSDSPISSLRLLQDKQRKETMDTVVISDDESGAIHEESDVDDDECDTSMDFTNVSAVDKYACAPVNNNDESDDAEVKEHLIQTKAEISNQDLYDFNHSCSSLNCHSEMAATNVCTDMRETDAGAHHCLIGPDVIPEITINDLPAETQLQIKVMPGEHESPRAGEGDRHCAVPMYSKEEEDNIMWL